MFLFQTMQWSKLNWDLSWEKRIDLHQVLPKPFHTYDINLDPLLEHGKLGPVSFLWQPPHSELNTWFDRPSEIFKSFVIEGTLEKARNENGDFSFNCHSVISLPNLFQSSIASYKLDFARSDWSNVNTSYKKRIGPYLYLNGTGSDLGLESIFEIYNNEIFMVFHSLTHYACIYANVFRYKLNEDESHFFKRFIDDAKELVDKSDNDLGDNEIQGAYYM
jgi:hypothetical protein